MIEKAQLCDVSMLCEHDVHISQEEMKNAIQLGRVYIEKSDGELAGWLRYNLFWDNTPFMNMLYIEEKHRGKGMGKSFVQKWEHDMKSLGYNCVMTSTQADEYAQHFYTHLGYTAVGGFTPTGDVYEIIFMKNIQGM